MLDSDKDDAYPPTHKAYWNAADAYLMGNVTPGGVYTQTHTLTHNLVGPFLGLESGA